MNPFQYDSDKLKPRPLVTWLIRLALLAGCLFTAKHNYSLYYRGLTGDQRGPVAAGIAFVLEAAFYFSVEGRGRQFVTDEQRRATAYGACALFIVIALNTVTDHAMNIGRVQPGDWLNAWATYGAAAAVVAVVGYIGYLKAHAPEAMLAAEMAKAEQARVTVASEEQRAVLNDASVREKYRAQARKWALNVVDQQTAERPPVDVPVYHEPETRRPNGKSQW